MKQLIKLFLFFIIIFGIFFLYLLGVLNSEESKQFVRQSFHTPTVSNTLLISNSYEYHYETIESIIVKHKEIIGNVDIKEIYLDIQFNKTFQKYIVEKYPFIRFGKPVNYHYFIDVTLYPKNYNLVKNKDIRTHFYISHRVSEVYNNAKNIFYLTPLSKYNVFNADIMPLTQKIPTTMPIYVIQGSWNVKRRNYELLEKILNTKFEYDYKIKLIGRGKVPEFLNKHTDRVILCDNYNFENYHKAFLDCYCIMPLIEKKSHPQYYKTTLTSSINYAKGFKLKCLIDKDLQDIYNLSDVEVYNDETDIVNAFKNTLFEFYKKKL